MGIYVQGLKGEGPLGGRGGFLSQVLHHEAPVFKETTWRNTMRTTSWMNVACIERRLESRNMYVGHMIGQE